MRHDLRSRMLIGKYSEEEIQAILSCGYPRAYDVYEAKEKAKSISSSNAAIEGIMARLNAKADAEESAGASSSATPPIVAPKPHAAAKAAPAAIIGKEWKLDSSAHNCSGCDTSFTLWVRKHHCRLCGLIFCSSCLAKTLPASATLCVRPAGSLTLAEERKRGTSIRVQGCKACTRAHLPASLLPAT